MNTAARWRRTSRSGPDPDKGPSGAERIIRPRVCAVSLQERDGAGSAFSRQSHAENMVKPARLRWSLRSFGKA
ncbi:hypothetical protein NDU88_002511 [Pleurodeles waltl]|uniref:Uncharacterized protein n=1 Tax=Pleurodeles waltl TaxID=8319 RepID=A0AAV7P6Z3_PLEWA|nr:hypothetical protein NDU88_002511 [Pleurodeles waltl]